jgi:predicted AAA+ superfamily ATPase
MSGYSTRCSGYVEINLEKKKIKSLSEEGDIQIKTIISEIEFLTKSDFQNTKSILFIDEIQAQPEVYVALRYFYEEVPEVAVIAAGSLLEVVLNEGEFSVPVGRVEYLHLGPMTFSEFLLALEETKLLAFLKSKEKPFQIPEAAHRRMLERLREYYIVGGMPESVRDFVKNNNFINTRRIQDSIIETYLDDFLKYSSKSQVDKLRLIFNFVPRRLGEKIKYSEIDREAKSRDLKKCVELLTLARVLIPVFHSESSGIPLEGQKDDSIYKLFFLDMGLVTNMLQIHPSEILEDQLLSMFEGKLAEQFIAQHLYYRQDFTRPRLHYWLRDHGSQKAELDFVIDKNGQVIPCEVKASEGGRLKSLAVFMILKKYKIAYKFDLNRPSVKEQKSKIPFGTETTEVTFSLQSFPLYAVEQARLPIA